jgi:carboxypeptidase Taq
MGWHYAALEERFRRIGDIEGALSILNWDTAVMMPKLAAPARGEQLATLKRLAHDLLTHAETGDHLAGADDEADLDPWQQANLREMRRKYRHAHALEPALVEALTRATTACEMTWREARTQADFAMLAPQLGRWSASPARPVR